MKLIKLYNDNETRYFSTKKKAAEFIGIVYQNLNYYMNYNKPCKGWFIEESYDNVMTHEVDKL